MTNRTGRPPHPDVLTPAEWRVLEQLRDSRPNAEIAVRLGISVNTVKYHVSNMLAKLEVPDRHALAVWDGQPKRRFGWFPSLPPVAMSLGTLGRGTAIVGALVAATAFAFALAANGDETPEARTDIFLRLGAGSESASWIGIDPLTGAPLDGAESLDFTSQVGSPLGTGGSLIWQTPFDFFDPPSGETVLTVVLGEPLGLRPSQYPVGSDGVVRRWTLPALDELNIPVLRPQEPITGDGFLYGYRAVLPSGDDEVWAFDLSSDTPTLLTTAPDVVNLHLTADGRLFVVARDPGIDLVTEGLAGEATRERYAVRAADYVAEIDRHDGSELARIEIGGPIVSSVLSDDQRQLYVIAEQDGSITAINLDTMQIRKLDLPRGGPWPGVIPFGPFALISLSADGRQLYQTGFDIVPCDPEASPDEYCRPRAIGLRIVDLETNAVLYEDPEANQLTRSPDGRWIITASRILGAPGSGTEQGLKIIDAASLKVVLHLEPDTAFRSVVIAADSRYAYALADIESGGIAPNPDCTQKCASVTVIDLERLAIIAKHVYDEPALALQSVP